MKITIIDNLLKEHNLTILDYVILNNSNDFFSGDLEYYDIFIKDKDTYNRINFSKHSKINIVCELNLGNGVEDFEIGTLFGYSFLKEKINEEKTHLVSNLGTESSSVKGNISRLIDNFIKGSKKNHADIDYEKIKKIFYNDFSPNGMEMSDLMDSIYVDHIQTSAYKFKENYLNFLDTGDELTNLYPSILNSLLNQNLTTCDTDSPSATYMEISTIINIRKIIGYTGNFSEIDAAHKIGGCFTVGGMMGNTLGILTARNNRYPNIQKKGIGTIKNKSYLIIGGGHSHYSSWTGYGWLGFGEDNVIHIPSIQGEMDMDILESEIKKILKEGNEVLAIITTLGNPYSMKFDNVKDVIKIGEEYGIWTHCDAANGGILIFSDRYKYLINGIHKFNSISLDFHKALGITYPSSLFLCRDTDSFVTNISEWNIINKPNSMDLGMTTPFVNSRGFDSFKLWFYIKYYGMKKIGIKVDSKILNTKNLFGILSKYETIKHLSSPESFGLIFIYIPRDKLLDYVSNNITSNEIDSFQHKFKNDLKKEIGIDINSYKLPSSVLGSDLKFDYLEVLSIHNSHESISYEMFHSLNIFLSEYN